MMEIQATIRWMGYDPSTLSPGSHKKVWDICGTEVDNGGLSMDDSGIDGIFCDDDCADAFLLECIEKVDSE